MLCRHAIGLDRVADSSLAAERQGVRQRKEDTVKTLAFGVTLVIMAVGAVGVVAPSGLVWVAEHSVTSGAFYVIATARVAFGLVLISVASVSRAPRTLRVLGYLILIAGIATALTGLVAMDRARPSSNGGCSRDPASSVSRALLFWPSEASSHTPVLPPDALPNRRCTRRRREGLHSSQSGDWRRG